MGCDIHCYIENQQSGSDHWFGFGGRINPGRNYSAFARLAGVRNYEEVKPVAEPRGRVVDGSWDSKGDDALYITESSGEGNCTPEDAARWVASGDAQYTNDQKNFVTHPDHHSHSWVTPDEWEQATKESGCEYRAMLAAMRSLENEGCKVRVVFWFDN